MSEKFEICSICGATDATDFCEVHNKPICRRHAIPADGDEPVSCTSCNPPTAEDMVKQMEEMMDAEVKMVPITRIGEVSNKLNQKHNFAIKQMVAQYNLVAESGIDELWKTVSEELEARINNNDSELEQYKQFAYDLAYVIAEFDIATGRIHPRDAFGDLGDLRKSLDVEEWYEMEDDEGREERRTYVGHIWNFSPSGRVYAPWSQIDHLEMVRDELYWEKAEAWLGDANLFAGTGEGDPTDLYVVEIRDKPEPSFREQLMQVEGVTEENVSFVIHYIENLERDLSYHCSHDVADVIETLSTLIGAHGEEAFTESFGPESYRTVYYVNSGETFATTICYESTGYDYDKSNWFVGSWGDWVAQMEAEAAVLANLGKEAN